MKGLKPFPYLLLGCIVSAILSGCAGSVPQNGPGALYIDQFTLAEGVPGVAYKQLLIASGGVTPYTWTISTGSLPPGLSLATDGVISGTPTTTGTYNFTVQVTDSQTPTHAVATSALSIMINPVLSLTCTGLPSGLVGSAYSATIQASNGVSPYMYAVAFGSLPAGLTLTTNAPPPTGGANSATISGTPTDAGVFNFTIQATDSLAEVATATCAITVTGRLEGNYTMSFNGFDSATNQPFYLVGSFAANGNGVITGGVIDQKGPGSTISADVPVTGTYSLPTDSNLGTVTLTYLQTTYTYSIALSSTGGSKLILADANHPQMWGSGLVEPQTSMTLPGNGANYTFGFFGNDSEGKHYAGAGMFAISATLSVTGGAEDTNDDGTASGELSITGGSFTSPNPTTGRGTASLDVTVNHNNVTYNYAYYTVSPSELIAVETDSASGSPATIVSMLQQSNAGVTGHFTNSSLSGQSVVELDGVSTSGSTTVPAAEIGVVAFDGNGNITGPSGTNFTGPCVNSGGTQLSGYCTDKSVGGTLSQNSYSGTYNVDASCGLITTPCGRVTVNLTHAPYQPVWYLAATNEAFVVGTDPDGMAGSLQPQTGFPYTISSLLGSYLGGTITPTLASVTNEIDVASTPPPGGKFAINYETNGPNGLQLSPPNFTGYYDCNAPGQTACSTTGADYGRFEVTTTSNQGAPVVSILYIVGTGTAGATGGKAGLVGLNAGQYNGTPDPNPRLTTWGR